MTVVRWQLLFQIRLPRPMMLTPAYAFAPAPPVPPIICALAGDGRARQAVVSTRSCRGVQPCATRSCGGPLPPSLPGCDWRDDSDGGGDGYGGIGGAEADDVAMAMTVAMAMAISVG